jgi:hypothetical protein
MSISLLTNFTVNQAAPIDDRLVVTNSSARDAIVYKYDGLTVFKTDDRTNWTWNESSATWSSNVSGGGNGIYGGSGALLGDTNVYTGGISDTSASVANKFIMSASASTSGVYFTNYFYRNTFGTDWTNVEYRIQYSHDSNTSDISYISFNGYDTSSSGIVFVTGNKNRMTITNNGTLRLWSPTYSADFNTSYLTANKTFYLPNTTNTTSILATRDDLSLQSVTNIGNVTNKNIQIISSPAHASTGYVNLYNAQSLTFSSSLSPVGGNFFSPIISNNIINVNATLNVPTSNILSAAIIVNTFNYTLAGANLVISQPARELNAMSALNIYHQNSGTLSGGVTDLAGIKIDGLKPQFYNTNITNYYGLLINPSYTVTGSPISDPYYTAGYGQIYIVNKWGIYQVGVSDKNYFAGPSTFNSTVTFNAYGFTNSSLTFNTSGGYSSANTGSPNYDVAFSSFNNVVSLCGVVTIVLPAPGGPFTILTLPTGFRPSKQVTINPRTTLTISGSITISTGGVMQFSTSSSAGTYYIYLDGVNFRLS